MKPTPVLSVRDLRISVPTDEGVARILDFVDFDLPRGHVLGIAGESGCGKSTLIRAMLGILPRAAVVESGAILFRGEDLLKRGAGRRGIGFIPQDPYLALNPVFKVGTQLQEILRCNVPETDAETGPARGRDRKRRWREHLVGLLRAVQIPDPEDALERYPHQFSGGQRQRLLIASALACRPSLILADEPTTALDVTNQAQILKLLKELVEQFGASMLFVTHDFGVIAELCDSVSVMYAGQIIETGATPAIVGAPLHPYTRALLACHPDRSDDFTGIPGQVPSPLSPPPGCRFNPRCDFAADACRAQRPPLSTGGKAGHPVACVLYENGARP
jgi:peptide/nickel transport system ATP-binding protein